MSDNRRVYRRIMKGLKQIYPPRELNGHQVRHLNTLAGMMTGIVQSNSCHLEKMAGKVPEATQVESRAKKMVRFLKNETIKAEIFYMPFLRPLVAALGRSGTITLAMDSSETGRGCLTLMISLIYRKRALPLVWHTVKQKKGHLPEETHLALLQEVTAVIPTDCQVVFLGDGEFDGLELQQALTDLGWEYICRTAQNRIVVDEGDVFALDEIGLTPGERIDMPQVGFTHERYGPVLVIAWWRNGYEEPLYLVSNMSCVGEACHWYRKRFRIETFFSDQKSRGFNLHKSHLSDPQRLARLLLAACLAYIWLIYLGVKVRSDQTLMRQVHRTDRCDLSLFQLGLRCLDHLLNRELPLPFQLSVPR